MEGKRNKTKVKAFSLSNEIVKKIEEQAIIENRSVSNFVETVLIEYFKMKNKITK